MTKIHRLTPATPPAMTKVHRYPEKHPLEATLRRIVLALIGTLVGTTLLIGLKAPQTAIVLGWSAESSLNPDAAAGDSLPGDSAGGPGAGGTGGAGGGGAAGNPQPTPLPGTTVAGGTGGGQPGVTGAPGSTAATRPAGTATRTTTAPAASRTITGTAVAAVWKGENYGNMQVRIVVTGSHIDNVTTIQRSNRPKTVPTAMAAEAVSKQSANLTNITGATASSDAFKASLQNAITQI